LTPENSEAPRENRYGDFVPEYGDFVPDTPPGAGLGVDVSGAARTKVSSPELASLAAKYVNMTDNELWVAVTGQHEMRYEFNGDGPQACADVRALAASVLAQAEGTPRK
jgi:hypothetical protein